MTTLTTRITCRFAALVTTTTAVVLVIGGLLLDRQVERGLEVLHDIEVRELVELIGADKMLTAADLATRIKHDADSDASLFVIQVADASGTVLFRSDNLGSTLLPAGRDDAHWTTTVPFLGRVQLSAYAIGPWRIQIGSPLEPSERLIRSYIEICVPLLIGVALVSVALGYAFSRSTLRPLRAIAATANRIRVDNLAERIPIPPGRDELSSLTILLNQTFDRLQASFEQVSRFSADASHELKTPLALIRLNVEKLRARLPADPDAASALDDVLEEINRMHQVIDRLLFLAKAESGALAVPFKPIDMEGFITSCGEDAEALAEDKGVRFVLGANGRGAVHGQPDLLRQLLLNVISNAVAATPRGGAVQLESTPAETGWTMTVSDEGPGVPESDLARIFDRFVRLQAGGQADRQGHGLGLAICKSIAELHRGTIRAENRKDRSGLKVTLSLPCEV